MSRMEETKYIPIISARNRTTLLDSAPPPLDTANKNCPSERRRRMRRRSHED